jgi:transglutaminase-like putative cysteine protease
MAKTDGAARAARNTDYAQALALGGLLAGASLSLSRLYVGNRWWLPTWLTMAAALGLAALLRRVGAGQLVSLVAMAAGFVVVAAILLFPSTLFVVLPTRATLAAMLTATDVAMQGIREKAAPVEVTSEFLLLTCAGAWAVATAADGLAFRARQPLLALVPALGLFVFPAVVRPGSPAWYTTWFLLGAAGLLLFEGRARLATWGRWVSSASSRPAAGWRLPLTPAAATGRWLALGAALLALAVPWLLPGYGQQPLLDLKEGPAPDTAGVGLNPFVSLRTRLRSPADVPVFTVTAAKPSYYRVMVLDRFDGVQFTPADRDPLQSLATFSGDTSRDQDPTLSTEQLTQRFDIQQLSSVFLPAATAPVAVNAGRGRRVYQSPVSRALSVKQLVKPGFRYTVTSRVALPTAAVLDGPVDYAVEQAANPQLALDLDVSNLDPVVRRLADQVVAGRSTPFRQALAIQDWLTSSEFHYSLDVPALSAGGGQLVRFLTQVRAGYCEQFAAAMAAMARAERIPARVAFGFTPGKQVGNQFTVTTHELHAWPELWFPRAGWVRFEPTPRADGQTVPPVYTTATGRQVGAGASRVAGAPNATAPSNTRVAPPLEREPASPATPSLLGPKRDRAQVLRQRLLAAAAVLLALLLVVPAVKATRNLLARRRAAARPRDAVAASYAEVAGWAGDAGIGRRAAETPDAYARRLAGEFAADAAPLQELTRLFERAEYAAGDPSVEEAHRARRLARSAQARLAGRLGWRRRALAALSPRSLLAPRPPLRRREAPREPVGAGRR